VTRQSLAHQSKGGLTMENKNKKRNSMLLIFTLLFIVILVIILVFFFSSQNDEKNTVVKEVKGERHKGWSDFYYADNGTWKMLDPASYVLREQKYVSSDRERDEYLVRRVPAGGILRITQAWGRWKHVEVLENGNVTAEGWIDAHFIKDVEKLE
jgi:hypothetical protein